MASMDDIRDKAEAAIDQAKPVVDGAKDATAKFAENAEAWASGEHPKADKAFEAVSGAVGGVASGAVDAMANGANAAFEFIKDRAEELTGKDVDDDGYVGRYRSEDVEAATELVVEEVANKVSKVAGDVQAAAELASEAVSDAVNKAVE